MIVTVEPAVSVRPDTVTTCAATATVPALDVVYPAATALTEGALQPVGIVSFKPPFDRSPVGTVYVKTRVLPACAAETFVVGVVAVPDPSGATIVIVGDGADRGEDAAGGRRCR